MVKLCCLLFPGLVWFHISILTVRAMREQKCRLDDNQDPSTTKQETQSSIIEIHEQGKENWKIFSLGSVKIFHDFQFFFLLISLRVFLSLNKKNVFPILARNEPFDETSECLVNGRLDAKIHNTQSSMMMMILLFSLIRSTSHARTQLI